MATQDTFRDINWDDMGGVGLSGTGKQMLAFAALYLGVLAYDGLLLQDGLNVLLLSPLGMEGSALGQFVANTTGPTLWIPFEAVGLDFTFTWDFSGTDWLFIVTVAVGYFYGVKPLQNNPRLAANYWRQFKKNRAAVVSAIYLAIIFVIGIVGPLFLQSPEIQPLEAYQPPVFMTVPNTVPISCLGDVATNAAGTQVCQGTWAYPLGTTGEGQGILKLLVLGMRVSMQVGLITMLLVITLGSLVGTTAAYFGGYVDEVLMRYVDLQASVPSFFLFLILSYFFEPTLFMLIALFGLLGWEGTARLVRSEALQRTEEEYVRAAENAGASDGWVIRRHILPNVSNTIITNASLLIPGYILFEAALAFLGVTDPGIASWGKTISAGRGDLANAPWIATIPGIFLFFTILGFNFLGDALGDALDPRRGDT
ncbi:ABC transporter permease [Halosegnis marinus]|uniref:ABC transporter permease n=1 Tax=Halosegnis marinus TaxID=3034023 RepID=A0ABD5ZNJ7_9EURY|nr:ABC transporter permease [Halosegnis sp. DT85]